MIANTHNDFQGCQSQKAKQSSIRANMINAYQLNSHTQLISSLIANEVIFIKLCQTSQKIEMVCRFGANNRANANYRNINGL